MRMSSVLGVGLFVLATINSIPAYSAHIAQWTSAAGGNGNYYEIVADIGGLGGQFWANAATIAEGRSHLGIFGHLATLTSAVENAFVAAFVDVTLQANPDIAGAGHHFWIGGRQDPAGSEPDGGWEWITGEAWDYTGWNSGEPNDLGTVGEDYLLLGYDPDQGLGVWLDSADHQAFFIVEYETESGATPVPEPSSLILFGTGLLGLFCHYRRNRKLRKKQSRYGLIQLYL